MQKNCLKCETPFETKSHLKFYCSRGCRETFNKQSKCVICGKEVKVKGFATKLCSKICKNKLYLKMYPPRSEKECNYCDQVRKYTDFRIVKPNKTGKSKGKIIGWRTTNNDYRASRCLACEKKEFEGRYAKNPFPQMRSNAKIRAKEDGRIFNVSTEYLKSIFPKDSRCPVLGVKFDMSYKKGGVRKYSPTVDKIIPEKGYVEGNLIVVSHIVNRLKSDANYEDMEKILKYYLKNKKETKYFYNEKDFKN